MSEQLESDGITKVSCPIWLYGEKGKAMKNAKSNETEVMKEYLAKLANDPEERAAMNRTWQREIRKEERKNPKNAAINFMKAIRF